MSEAPNPADFSVDEREGEYQVIIEVSGEIFLTIKAEDHADAERQASEIVGDDDRLLELDEVYDARIVSVYKSKPMFRVMSEGRKAQVTRLEPGMTPREPDEYGF